jgi:hypothetical protein
MKGTALVWNIATTKTGNDEFGNWWLGTFDSSFSKLPSDMQATPSDPQITLFLVYQKYDYGESPSVLGPLPGYADIAVIYWPSLELVGKYSVHAKQLNFSPAQNQNIDDRIDEWVEGLYNPTITYTQEQLERSLNVTVDTYHTVYCSQGTQGYNYVDLRLGEGELTVPLEAKLISGPTADATLSLSFSDNPFTVRVGDLKIANLTITIPQNAPSGTYKVEVYPDKTAFPDWSLYHQNTGYITIKVGVNP